MLVLISEEDTSANRIQTTATGDLPLIMTILVQDFLKRAGGVRHDPAAASIFA